LKLIGLVKGILKQLRFGFQKEMRAFCLRKLTYGLWSEKRDSNPRPQPWQGCALPAELFSLEFWYERGDLNSHIIMIPDPKSGASANSATLALLRIGRNGAPGRIRTYDLWIRSPLLYPAELQAHVFYNLTGANDEGRTRDNRSHNPVLYQLSYIRPVNILVRPRGFEPLTY
jgi:hypothetical protein